jgi:telomere length regulation protein
MGRYIRDLISGLRDVDNYGRYNLALKSASNLLRRKANFGTEVSDHIEELATILVGLANKYNEDNFQEWRLQGMIAILVARPLQMGQWFSNACFNGDYSLGQRASILTTLSMGARELAGYQEEDAALTGSNMVSKDPFPSKKLPDKYHKIYAIEASPVNLISQKLEQVMIQPMAIDVAEKLSGPTALKVRTFSSRMEVEKKRKRPITNELAKIVAEAFFLPLTGRWRAQAYIRYARPLPLEIRTDPSSGPSSPFNTAYLLTHFLKTVALIFHASGPSTVSLPMLTRELWALLLSLRGAALGALPVTEALLFALLTVLEVNGNDQRRLAEENAQELLETQAWAEQVFERVGGGSEEGERVRMLAAGVLTRAHEVVEKYQRLLMGDLVDFI